MNYKEALLILSQAEQYGASVPDIEFMTEKEIIEYAEQMTRYADALEAGATGN